MKTVHFAAVLSLSLGTIGSAGAADVTAVDEAFRITRNEGGFGALLAYGDHFGAALVELGDLDGDGVSELVASASADDRGTTTDAGALHVLFRNRDGTIKSWKTLDAALGSLGTIIERSEFFGQSLAALGDLDGDGIPDLAVGVPEDDEGGPLKTSAFGAVWILFLNADGTSRDELKIGQGLGGFGGSLHTGSRFGSSLANLGDLDGDGLIELAIGMKGDDDGQGGGLGYGALWIVSLDATGVQRELKIGRSSGGFGGVLDPADGFGGAVCSLGDLDGDGINDIAVGAPDIAGEIGEAWILFLNSDGSVRTQTELGVATSHDLAGYLYKWANFGSSMTATGDLDGDGVTELAIGAPLFRKLNSNQDQGAVFLLYLDAGGAIKSAEIFDHQVPLLSGALTDFGLFGSSLTMVTDTEWPWLCVGASGQDQIFMTPGEGAYYNLRLCTDQLTADFSSDKTVGALPLDVSFADLSSGPVSATSWEWEFGDGTSSTLQNPTHTYTETGTFDVSLRVAGSSLGCLETKLGLIQVVEPTATVTSRNGSGTNPNVFTALSGPVLGTTWAAEVDGSALGWDGVSVALAYLGSSAGLFTNFGEVLVDLSSPQSATHLAAFVSNLAQHNIPIPSDQSLLGLALSVQVIALSPQQLTNALDVVIGN